LTSCTYCFQVKPEPFSSILCNPCMVGTALHYCSHTVSRERNSRYTSLETINSGIPSHKRGVLRLLPPAAPGHDEVTSPESVSQALAPHPAADQTKSTTSKIHCIYTSLHTMAKSFRELVGIPASTASTEDSILLIIDAQNE